MTSTYKICKKCIMDTTDPDIQFDENGICNHCKKYEERAKNELYDAETGKQKLNFLVNKIKKNGKNNEYDCIIGVSGGVDSTMVAYKVKELGLRPLAVHLDNGWDSEPAVNNIEKMLKILDIELYTYVIDWEEFKDLQLSFLKASITNAEIPSDHAIFAILYHVAAEKGIKYIITGANITTESTMPASWAYDMKDLRFIKAIQRRFGKVKLKSFPQLSPFDFLYYTFVKGIRTVGILNYMPYNRKNAIQIIEQKLGWKNYGGKHCESLYTRFFQSYILPRKFNIDKRKIHLSGMIWSGQLTREEALKEHSHDFAPENQLNEDKKYLIKKLGITDQEFERIMSLPVKTVRDYPSYQFIFNNMGPLVRFTKKVATHRPAAQENSWKG